MSHRLDTPIYLWWYIWQLFCRISPFDNKVTHKWHSIDSNRIKCSGDPKGPNLDTVTTLWLALSLSFHLFFALFLPVCLGLCSYVGHVFTQQASLRTESVNVFGSWVTLNPPGTVLTYLDLLPKIHTDPLSSGGGAKENVDVREICMSYTWILALKQTWSPLVAGGKRIHVSFAQEWNKKEMARHERNRSQTTNKQVRYIFL